MKIGIVGFGKMGLLHGALLSSVPDVTLSAITDTSRILLKAFQSVLPEVKYFHSYETMIDNCDLDAIVIATPSSSHVPIAKYAAKRDNHLFIEKPLSATLEQALELHECVKNTKIKVMIGFVSRYMPSFLQAKKNLDANKLGKIISVYAENYSSDVLKKEKGWRYNKKISGGGVVLDFSVHIIDLLFYYFGCVKSIDARTKKIYSETVEDEVHAEILFENGIPATMNSSWSNPNYRKFYMKIEVKGEQGDLIVTDQTLTVNLKNDENGDQETERFTYPDLYGGYFMDIAGPYYSIQMQRFVDAIKHNQQIESDIESGCYVQKIVDLLYRSAEQKRPLNFS